MRIEHGIYMRPLVYQKVVEPNHFMIKFQGFGISKYVINKLIEKDVKFIIIVYIGEKKTRKYLFSLKQYVDSELVHVFQDKDIQKFVNIKHALEF